VELVTALSDLLDGAGGSSHPLGGAG